MKTTQLPLNGYRLQMTPQFGFSDVRAILPYLKELGVTDLYFSPIFKARAGSTHGYDITDPMQLNPELGDEKAFTALVEESQQLGFGWIQDIVPNHMAFSRENRLLMDVLENGRCSKYAHYFDIYWDHNNQSLRGRILAPFLGRFLGECLKDGEIGVGYDEQGFSIEYYSVRFPMRIESYGMILERCLPRVRERTEGSGSEWVRFMGILYLIHDLSENPDGKDRQAYTQHIKESLYSLYGWSVAVKESINAVLGELKEQNETSAEILEDILQKQVFRMSFWKVSSVEISYRRFFNINELICVRVEAEDVFDACHEKIVELSETAFTALRVDHVDGLFDPASYLKRLKSVTKGIPIYVEKILAETEQLPRNWPVEGTTGYEYMNFLNGLYCDRSKMARMDHIYTRFCNTFYDYKQLEYEKKRMIVSKNMAGDVDNLAYQLKEIAVSDLYGSDITMEGLKTALVEIMAYLGVYRSYITKEGYTKGDKEVFEEAIAKALAKTPDDRYEILFVERCLFARESFSDALQENILLFIHRLQQFTGPVTAKGIEDTLFYCYNRLLSLNEVGGFPEKFGVRPREFHALMKRRQRQTPASFNATTTHDTKRGEDLRARLNVLSEIPMEWEGFIKDWNKRNQSYKMIHKKRESPDRNDEYFLYQTLVGTLPKGWASCDKIGWTLYEERIRTYILKSIREAKIHTEWIKPDDTYESAYLGFINALLDRKKSAEFLESLEKCAEKVRFYGFLNSLSQLILKAGSPGVFDLYQGSEVLNLSLVDPDNRKRVDFTRLEASLQADAKHDALDFNATKLTLTHTLLSFRQQYPELFLHGSYTPLYATGKFKDHIIAFMLEYENKRLIVLALRMMTRYYEMGKFPAIPSLHDLMLELDESDAGIYRNILDGKIFSDRQLSLSQVFEILPGAVLLRDGSEARS